MTWMAFALAMRMEWIHMVYGYWREGVDDDLDGFGVG
jgi:hypothetical protein